jgi:nucleotide-binding universal stress UspA family protein
MTGRSILVATDRSSSSASAVRGAFVLASQLGVEVVRMDVVGVHIDDLLQAAKQTRAELIVLGTERRAGIAGVLHGSVSSALIRRATCPVAVFAEGQELESPVREVLVAVDLSPVARDLVQLAASMLGEKPGRLVVVGAVEVPSPFALSHRRLSATLDYNELDQHGDTVRESIRDLLEDFDLPRTIEARVEIVYDEPASAVALVAERRRPDIVVVGRSGHSTLSRALLGSTTAKLLATVPRPTIVVPALR